MRYLIVLLIALFLAVVSYADINYTLTTPEPPEGDAVIIYVPEYLCLNTKEEKVSIRLNTERADGSCALDSHGECRSIFVEYRGAQAITQINFVSTANFSSVSLWSRMFTQLVNDGYLPSGAIAGTPGISTYTPTPLSTPTPTS